MKKRSVIDPVKICARMHKGWAFLGSMTLEQYTAAEAKIALDQAQLTPAEFEATSGCTADTGDALMGKLRAYNTRAAKLSTAQVRAMYEELMNGATQSSMARKYGLGVIQVGRIARGESRAQETGANSAPIPDFNKQVLDSDIQASMARLREKLEQPAAAPPSLYSSPVPYDEPGLSAGAQAKIERALGERVKSPGEELEGLLDEKGDEDEGR